MAVKGCTEIVENIKLILIILLSACGTGGTISGLICGLNGKKNIIGDSGIKRRQFSKEGHCNRYKNFRTNYSNWKLNLNYHFGGYAKITKELIEFINNLKKLNNIQLDPIYTGKLLFGFNEMINNNELPRKFNNNCYSYRWFTRNCRNEKQNG